ncbi:MAG: hypothetical protein IKZ07_07165 [Akkermansia sp.]|nr:hypothetical protein [Akkermansia sp.]
MTSSHTRQRILAHTHYALMNRTVAFTPYEENAAIWESYLFNIETAVLALRTQLEDYCEAKEREEILEREAAKAEAAAAEAAAEPLSDLID